MIHFSKEQLRDFKATIQKEWSMTNGIGGYAGGSINGALGRTHQGYLIASLHPPVDRFLVFAKTNESITRNDQTIDFSTAQHAGVETSSTVLNNSEVPAAYQREDTVAVASDFVAREAVYTEGNRFLTSFDYDGTISFSYAAEGFSMQKSIALVHGQNRCVISYDLINNGETGTFSVTPLMNYRDHSHSSTPETLLFEEKTSDHGFALVPDSNPDISILVRVSAGSIVSRQERFDQDLQLATEVELETPGLDTHFTPFDIQVELPAHTQIRISLDCQLCDTTRSDELLAQGLEADSSQKLIDLQKKRYEKLIKTAGYKDSFCNCLVLASDAFLSQRASTGLTTVLAGLPWFTDWGRDTMIAFTGLTLCTKRFDKAREILETFSRYIQKGLVPNMFPDDNQAPLYNTVDASLWYFYAVYKYLEYDQSKPALDFVAHSIYPALLEILSAYEHGTDFSIYMDKDGLIHAGSGVDQVTWMDVRVGDWVVTPRHGKPVEINALWYNALCVMQVLTQKLETDYPSIARADLLPHWQELEALVKKSFIEKFWNPEWNCLYDVVDSDEEDDCIRPNQIYAVSLPFTMLSPEKEKAIVEKVQSELFVGVGLRSLARGHKDYHGIYCGSLPKRDAAYHQGTAWGFLLGGFYTAFMKVNHHSPESAQKAQEMLAPLREHLYHNGIGSICEIFDGDAPHKGRGCYAQAWSVGEVLRAYTEDILPYCK